MKSTLKSLAVALALCVTANAGGKGIEKAQSNVEPIAAANTSNGFYLGAGAGKTEINDDTTSEKWESTMLTLLAGYRFNPFLSVEGRYGYGFDTDYDKGITLGTYNGVPLDNDISSWGVYLKPAYPVGDFSLYALLGYGGIEISDLRGGDAYADGFQWGVGASYAMTNRLSLFVDYLVLYDDTGFDYVGTQDSWDANNWTFGFTYSF
jgi:opacity protein-like surface antigen